MTQNTSKKLEESYESVHETIKLFPNQLKQAWEEVGGLPIPREYQNINKIALCGMGGSALEGRIVDSLLVNRIRVPFEIFNQYHVPNYTDPETLIISYSYSGNTEETVSALNEAITRDAKVFVVTSNGKLEDIATEHSLPHYVIDPKYNPSKQPRNATGYAVGAVLSLFVKLGIAHVTDEEIQNAFDTMQKVTIQMNEEASVDTNSSLSTSKKFKDKGLIMVGSEHLIGTVHTIKNQLNESAKTFSTIFELPELNHHLLEGLKNPKGLKNKLHFWFFNSNLYSDRVQKRYPLTQEVIEKNGYDYSEYKPLSETKIEQVFETLMFGSYTVYYLSKSYGIDPNKIPYVDWFKEKLK